MNSLRSLLTSPDALEKMTTHERDRIAARLLAQLGEAFARVDPVDAQTVRIWHEPSGVEFTLIPGGAAQVGLSAQDVSEVAKHIELELVEYSIEVDGASALPVRSVTIAPFLCGCKPLPCGTTARNDASARVSELGFRLPSEVELEWILRDGGRYALTLGATPVAGKPGRFTFQPSRYGVEGLLVANWAGDDWHPNYDGAPATPVAWMNGDAVGVCRSTFPLPAMAAEEDIAVLLAALRSPGSEHMPAVARAALDLPLD